MDWNIGWVFWIGCSYFLTIVNCYFVLVKKIKYNYITENMLLFPKVPLILWIGYKQSTRCGRVHFEHRHRKWSVITVRPTTSVRKSPRRIYRPATHPIHFAADSPDKIHRCAAWAVFFFFTNKILCSCSIFQNLFLAVDRTTLKCYSCA